MIDYRRLYYMLFAALADATEYLEAGEPEEALARLIDVQKDAEELYISENLAEEEYIALSGPLNKRIVPMTLKKMRMKLRRDI